jgi:L-lactate utilization protein LutC
MTKPMIKIHNIATDEVELREMNDAEYAQWLEDSAKAEANILELEQAEAKKTAAEAKLAALGLTADDLKALGLGGN